VDINNDGVDGTRQLLNHVRNKLPSALVLEPECFTVVIAKPGNGKVEIAVAIARHPRETLSDHVTRKLLVAVVLEHDHGPYSPVVRKERSKAGHHQIQIAVTVEIDCLHVRGRLDGGR